MRTDETEQLTRDGGCFCGAVALRVEGEPVAMGYCHCASCRRWSAGPVNAFSLWPPARVHVTHGADEIASYARTPNSIRKWCRRCGGHLMTEHPQWEVTDVYAAVIDGLDFTPGVHVNYAERVLTLRDGLPKQRDFPTELGGSGALVDE